MVGSHQGIVGDQTVLAARQGGVVGMVDHAVAGKARVGCISVVEEAEHEAGSRQEFRVECRGGAERQFLSPERPDGC
jgi:cell shape-determining protein MreC